MASRKRKNVEKGFFLCKKTRWMQSQCILRILNQDEIQTFHFYPTTKAESLDLEIRKRFGMKPADESYYFLFNEKNHQVPLVPSRFPDDFNLRLEELSCPKEDYTMRETVAWKRLSEQITQNAESLSFSLCDLITEYALDTLYYVGGKVDAFCFGDGLYWVATIIQKSSQAVRFKFDGWNSRYNQLREMDTQEDLKKDKDMGIEPHVMYPMNFSKNLLECAGTHTGATGIKSQTRYAKPWQCAFCKTWSASHVIRCHTAQCRGRRPVSEERWCLVHITKTRNDCTQCEWQCDYCQFVNEPYYLHCEDCDQTRNPHWGVGTILNH
jgi:hypothetical protein